MRREYLDRSKKYYHPFWQIVQADSCTGKPQKSSNYYNFTKQSPKNDSRKATWHEPGQQPCYRKVRFQDVHADYTRPINDLEEFLISYQQQWWYHWITPADEIDMALQKETSRAIHSNLFPHSDKLMLKSLALE
jgi:hypothetical protein